jgi:hypothetical protein
MVRPASLLAFLAALAAAGPIGCHDWNDIRRGGKGESCGRTDDCQSPLVCIDLTCVEPGGGGNTGTTIITGEGGAGGATGDTTKTAAGGSGGQTTTSEGGAGAGGSGGGTGGLDYEMCASCIDAACAAQLTACDDGCFKIDACVQMTCSYLSAIGATGEEDLCQQNCQQQYLGSKTKHINVAVCAINAWPNCAPCSSYPHDYNKCIEKAAGGACQASLDACNASSDCVQYRECVGSCPTLTACLACDDTPEGAAGRALLFEYNLCLSGECILESWLP